MSTRTLIYRYCIAKEDNQRKDQKLLKKELKKRFRLALKELDKASTLEDQQNIIKALS